MQGDYIMNWQGAMLDDIEANMVRTSTKTRDATKELRQADKSQRSSRNKVSSIPTYNTRDVCMFNKRPVLARPKYKACCCIASLAKAHVL